MQTKCVFSSDTLLMEWPNDDRFHMMWKLVSGLEVNIMNEWDWLVFCDIFVNREYPLYLQKVNPNYKVKILDLGANVGYFSLYAANECIKLGQPFKILAFEGNTKTFEILKDRVRQCDHILALPYLVGKKEGTEQITDSANHGTSQVSKFTDKEYPSLTGTYSDLNNLLALEKIDIIKCDIEGSEFEFVENYPELLKMTDIVYMEIHHKHGDVKKLHEQMKKYGFNKNVMLLDRDTNTVEVFIRAQN